MPLMRTELWIRSRTASATCDATWEMIYFFSTATPASISKTLSLRPRLSVFHSSEISLPSAETLCIISFVDSLCGGGQCFSYSLFHVDNDVGVRATAYSVHC